MFKTLTAVEPLNLLEETEKKLKNYCENYIAFKDFPKSEAEIIERIKDSDGILLNVNTTLSENVLRSCKKLKYIGLCCTLYEDESCSVHLPTARELGITVTGVSDYGDNGVPEFVIYALTNFLHGFSGDMWLDMPMELSNLNAGVLGLGTTGTMVAEALKHFGANVSYYARHKKAFADDMGFKYRTLDEITESCPIICTCLNKNVLLLNDDILKKWCGNKILINTSLSPSFSLNTIRKWLDDGNHLFCDSLMALGDKELLNHPNVKCMGKFAGSSRQSVKRLGDGVINNIENYFK